MSDLYVSQSPVIESATQGGDVAFDDLDLSALSPELANRIESAFQLQDTPTSPNSQSVAHSEDEPLVAASPDRVEPQSRAQLYKPEVLDLTNHLSRFSGQLPKMNLQTHMYSSDANRRWVKINGKEYQEGDWIEAELQLLTISAQSVTVEFNQQQIKLPALYDWLG
ncbi:general secretion pathway protein GspB [Vibrio sp. 10N.286.49.B3]|uniref:general secretion pathway protein GspB n=1 Tax=Vibrio sp. 10N.286.49.B3 TaxID=1880855 RepID=UPI0032201BAA